MSTALVQTGVQFPDTSIQTTAAQNINTFPSGGIIMWSGSVVPPEWKLCDGTNGTPNLIGQFIYGAGGSKALNSTGGSTSIQTAQLPSHTHSANFTSPISGGNTDEGGYHSHNFSSDHGHIFSGNRAGGGGGGGQWYMSNFPGGQNFTSSGSGTGIGIQNAGEHQHNLSGSVAINAPTDNTGNGEAYLPLYYALAYIMKQ